MATTSSVSSERSGEVPEPQLGFVLQTFNLIPYLSAIENVMVPMSLANVKRQRRHGREGESLMERLGLADRSDHLPRELSVGQQQRVAIARARNDPEVILADEPTGNLDPGLSREILDILRDLNAREGRTIVMVTHSPEAAKVGRQRIHLVDGGCAAEGAVSGSGADASPAA